jgi:hypothetical protein
MKIDRRKLTAAEKRMIRAMTDFTYDNPRHKPWEVLVEASRQEVERAGGKR